MKQLSEINPGRKTKYGLIFSENRVFLSRNPWIHHVCCCLSLYTSTDRKSKRRYGNFIILFHFWLSSSANQLRFYAGESIKNINLMTFKQTGASNVHKCPNSTRSRHSIMCMDFSVRMCITVENQMPISLKKIFFWSIVDLQCCVKFRCTAEWISYTYIHFYLDYFPIQVITEYWVQFHVLYNMSLLGIKCPCLNWGLHVRRHSSSWWQSLWKTPQIPYWLPLVHLSQLAKFTDWKGKAINREPI